MKNRLPRTVFAVALVSALTEAGMAVEMAEIQGSWRLVEAGGQAVENVDNAPRFTLEDDRIHGYDGCNQFSGPLDNPQMMIMGQRACAGDYVKLPLDLTDPKAHLAAGTLEGGMLVLPERSTLPTSRFERQGQ